MVDVVTMSPNQFLGGIPVELGNLNCLEELSLERNRLTGEVPPPKICSYLHHILAVVAPSSILALETFTKSLEHSVACHLK